MPELISNPLRIRLEEVLMLIREAIQADIATLHLYNAEQHKLFFPIGIALHDKANFERSIPDMSRLPGQIVRERSIEFIDDAINKPNFAGRFTSLEGVRSAVGAALLNQQNEVMGVVFLNYRQRIFFTPEKQAEICNIIADFSQTLDKLLQEIPDSYVQDSDRRLENEMRLLNPIIQALHQNVYELTLWLPRANKRMEKTYLHLVYASYVPDTQHDNTIDINEWNVVARAFREKTTLEMPLHDTDAPAYLKAFETVLAIPLLNDQNDALGVLCAYTHEPHFEPNNRQLIDLHAQLMSQRLDSERQIYTLSFVSDLSNRLSSVLANPQNAELTSQMLRTIVEAVADIMDAPLVTIYRYDEVHKRFPFKENYPPNPLPYTPTSPKDDKLAGYILNVGLRLVEDIANLEPGDPAYSIFAKQKQVKSYIGIVLKYYEQPLGVLYINYRRPYRFTSERVSLVKNLAYQISNALYTLHLQEQTHRLINRIEQISPENTTDTRMNAIMEYAQALLGSEIVSIGLPDYSTRELVFRYALNQPANHRVPIHSSVTGKVFLEKRVIRLNNLHDDPHPLYNVISPDTKSELDVPLFTGDRVVGVLNFESSRSHAFTLAHETLAKEIAARVAGEVYNNHLLSQEHILHKVLQHLTNITTLPKYEMLQMVHQQLKESNVMYADNMYIALYDAHENMISFAFVVENGIEINPATAEGAVKERWKARPIDPTRIGRTEWIILNWEPLFHPNQHIGLDWYESDENHYAAQPNISHSWIGAPMLVNNQILGIIALYHPDYDDVFTPHDLEMLQTLANFTATALENTRLYSQVELQRSALIEIGTALSFNILEGRDVVLDTFYATVCKIFDTANMYIALYSPKDRMLSFPLALQNGEFEDWQPRKFDSGRTEWIIINQQPIRINTRKESINWYEQHAAREHLGDPFSSFLGVPMQHNGKIHGVIAVYHPEREHLYSEEHENLLVALANQMAAHLESVQLLQEVQKLQEQKIAFEKLGALQVTMGALQHRMQNTVSLIPGNVTILRNPNITSLQDPIAQESLEIIERNAKAASRIIARLQEPLKELTYHPIDINEMLRDVQSEQQMNWHDVAIELHLLADVPIFEAPSGQIHELFSNLVENACRVLKDYRADGKVIIATQLTDNQLEVRVIDNGPGIPQDKRNKLFNGPVQRSDSSGLGLWLNQLFLKSIGGYIKIEERPDTHDNTGATILVSIPV